jgi:hypothetical protein
MLRPPGDGERIAAEHHDGDRDFISEYRGDFIRISE